MLAARAAGQHEGTEKESKLDEVFESKLVRYEGIYRRSSYQNIPLAHLYSSAINWAALIAYEYKNETAQAGHNSLLYSRYLDLSKIHEERINGFINGIRRSNNLDVVPHRPYIMPYRGVFLYPYSEALKFRLLFDRDYWMQWNGGIVAVIKDDTLAEYRNMCDEMVRGCTMSNMKSPFITGKITVMLPLILPILYRE